MWFFDNFRHPLKTGALKTAYFWQITAESVYSKNRENDLFSGGQKRWFFEKMGTFWWYKNCCFLLKKDPFKKEGKKRP